MSEVLISTMPIKPYTKTNIGLMIAPVLCDIIGKNLNCTKALSFNLLHSYDNKEENLDDYMQQIRKFDIGYDKIIRDIDYVDRYMEEIEKLYNKKIVVPKKGTVLRCNCGRVEMTAEAIQNHKNGDLYTIKGNKAICNFCGKECKEYTQQNLYLEINEQYCKDIEIYPFFLKKEINNLKIKYNNKNLLISKNRQNDYFLSINGKKFNIDIDMLWTMFNHIESSDEQVLIASNHQIYEMFISNYINNLLNDKRLFYIATPYLTNNEKIDIDKKIFFQDNVKYKKLAVLYSLKWKYKTLNWNNGILEMLNKLESSEIDELYKLVTNLSIDDNTNLEKKIGSIMNDINLNRNIKLLRR